MAATFELHKYTGANAATENGPITGFDFSSADNATNSAANRATNPVYADSYSMETVLRLKVTAAPDNAIRNVYFWSDSPTQDSGANAAPITIYYGVTASPTTPTASQSAIATTDVAGATSGAKVLWDAGDLTALNETTDALVLQLHASAAAAPGDIATWTLEWSYDEL